MKFLHLIFTFILGCLAAIVVHRIVHLINASATFDAWFLTFTLQGQDVGDRMTTLFRDFFRANSTYVPLSVSYLIGQSVFEELIKFFAFFIAFLVIKPVSMRQIVLIGIIIGIGFATVETSYFGFHDAVLPAFILRVLGHSLFTGIVCILFSLGYFIQMRWIDGGARRGVMSWILQYEERILQIFWTCIGFIIAASLHAGVNIVSLLGGEYIAIFAMLISWVFCILFLMQPASNAPYGTIIRRVELLRNIREAEKDLQKLGKTRSAHKKSLSTSKYSSKVHSKSEQ